MLKKFIAASLKGWSFALDNPAQSIKHLKTVFPEVNEKLATQELAAITPLFCSGGAKYIGKAEDALWTKTQDLLSEVKLLPAGQDPKSYYTNDYLPPASQMRAVQVAGTSARCAGEADDERHRDALATATRICTSGMAFRSPGRTITDADLVGFAGLTGDYSELHTSDVYGKASQFGRRVAHGMLGLAYAHGLMWARTGELRETAIAFLGISDWKFVGPIYVGDTIFVNYRIAELRDSKSRPTQAIATFDVEVVDQDDRAAADAAQQGAAGLQGAARPPSPRRSGSGGVTAGGKTMREHLPVAGRSPASPIRIDRVAKTFGEDTDQPFRALKEVSVDIAAGEFVSVVGPSGCGKSTLMLMVAGLLERSRGDIAIGGTPVTKPITDVGIAFQDHLLLDFRTAFDNVTAACGHPQAAAQAARGARAGAVRPAAPRRTRWTSTRASCPAACASACR